MTLTVLQSLLMHVIYKKMFEILYKRYVDFCDHQSI